MYKSELKNYKKLFKNLLSFLFLFLLYAFLLKKRAISILHDHLKCIRKQNTFI